MRKLVVALLVVVSSAAPAASALPSVSGSAGRRQVVAVEGGIEAEDVRGDVVYLMGRLYVEFMAGADAGDPASPGTFRATGYADTYDAEADRRGWIYFPPQDVGAATLTSDPLGTTVSFEASLLDTDTQAHPVSVRLTRPTSTTLGHPSTQSPGFNAWWDASGASARYQGEVLVHRTGYTIEARIGTLSLSWEPGCTACGWGWATTVQGASATPEVRATV
ncbi:MAG TPA: hypothetical protein VM840_05200 [Actinomycetota bacterium]|nr:hypothetical protein [Actinomycetota bacterium]